MRERNAGLPRRRRDLFKNFHVGGLELSDFARHLVLTGGDLVKALPHCGKTQRYLLYLLRVDGWGGGRADGDRLRNQPTSDEFNQL